MHTIPQILEKIAETKKKLGELEIEWNKYNKIKEDLIKTQQDICSHPDEYLEVTNRYDHDDYGRLIQVDIKDYIYKCSACGAIMENR